MQFRNVLGLLLFVAACDPSAGSLMGPALCSVNPASCPDTGGTVAATLGAITPQGGPSAGGITLTLDGQDFRSGAQVRIGGIAATQASVLSPTQLTARLPAHPGAFGPVPVTVQNPGAAATTRDDLFNYYASQLAFPLPRHNTGQYPYRLAAADFNGDGKLDIATTNQLSGDVSVLFGDGGGGFADAVNFPVSVGLCGIAVADINQDGKIDILTNNWGSGDVSVLLGDGKGGFASAVSSAVGAGPKEVVIADWNGDGKPDLAAISDATPNLIVLLGNGQGGFAAAGSFPVGNNLYRICSGDFNLDGNLDIAVSVGSLSSVSVLLGNGAGGFGAANIVVGVKTADITTSFELLEA